MSRGRSLWLRILIAFVALLTSQGFAGSEGIASVDMDRILSRYYRTAIVNQRLERRSAELRAEYDELAQRLSETKATLEMLRAKTQQKELPVTQREQQLVVMQATLADFRRQERAIEQFSVTYSKEIEEMGQRLHNDVVHDIEEAVSAYATEADFDLVIDSSAKRANGVKAVLHRNPRIDITAPIIDRLNEGRERTFEEMFPEP